MSTTTPNSLIVAALLLVVSFVCLLIKLWLQRRAHDKELAIVEDFAARLFGKVSSDDILWGLAQSCISKLGFEDCVVYLYNKTSGVLIQKAAFGPKNPHGHAIKNPLNLPIGHGIVGNVALTGKAEIVNDTSKDARYIPDETVNASEICVPIIYEGELLGVIDSENSKKGYYTSSHLRLLKTLSSLCAAKLTKVTALYQGKIYGSQLDSLIQLIPDFMVVSTPSGKRRFVNKSYCEFMGKMPSEMISENIIESLPAQERATYQKSLQELSPKNPTMTNVQMNMGANNKTQWTLWNETAVFTKDGDIKEILSIGRDINAFRQSQNLRENYIHTLEEILQKTSHQVRQPIAQILGIIEILRTDQVNDLDEMLTYMRKSVSQLDLVTRELNDYIHDNSMI
ncbi:MAG: GAF domain-containing protein [Flavobacteriales bacterium]|nr:GAF domain-containing protein [Flavobacteriales bacterium]